MVKDYLIDRSNNRVVEISGINVLYTNQFCFNSNPIQVLGYNNNPWISLPETEYRFIISIVTDYESKIFYIRTHIFPGEIEVIKNKESKEEDFYDEISNWFLVNGISTIKTLYTISKLLLQSIETTSIYSDEIVNSWEYRKWNKTKCTIKFNPDNEQVFSKFYICIGHKKLAVVEITKELVDKKLCNIHKIEESPTSSYTEIPIYKKSDYNQIEMWKLKDIVLNTVYSNALYDIIEKE